MLNNIRFMFFVVLIIAVAGCNIDAFQDSEPEQLTVTELSQLASEAVVYVEALQGEHVLAFGSGFIIDPDGLVVTNYHVLEGADDARVTLGDEDYRVVSVLASSRRWDLAVLRVDGSGFAHLELGKGLEHVQVGQDVVAVGNPEGLRETVSDGIVSAVRFDDELDMELIQTTAPVSSGSSGGPLLDMVGRVIGVTTFTYAQGQNLNFAVPVDMIHELMDDLGSERTVADVFIGDNLYEHEDGQLAVVLEWQGDFDLDLEIWSEGFEFLGAVYELGDSPDILNGNLGQEWFVFDHGEFATGVWVVSPYYVGPETEQGIVATVTVYYPDGSTDSVSQELLYWPPYDQWFALAVDVDDESIIVLDMFDDAEPGSGRYVHSRGDLAVVLDWHGDYDLDLEIWSDEFEFIGTVYELGDSPDIMSGYDGNEWFVFDHGEFATGVWVVSPFFIRPETEQGVVATVTVYYPDGSTDSVSQELLYWPPYDQWFALAVDVDDKSIVVLDLFDD